MHLQRGIRVRFQVKEPTHGPMARPGSPAPARVDTRLLSITIFLRYGAISKDSAAAHRGRNRLHPDLVDWRLVGATASAGAPTGSTRKKQLMSSIEWFSVATLAGLAPTLVAVTVPHRNGHRNGPECTAGAASRWKSGRQRLTWLMGSVAAGFLAARALCRLQADYGCF